VAELAALTCVPLAGRCDHHRRVVWFAAAPALRARVTEAPTIRAITLPGPSSPPHRVAAQRDDGLRLAALRRFGSLLRGDQRRLRSRLYGQDRRPGALGARPADGHLLCGAVGVGELGALRSGERSLRPARRHERHLHPRDHDRAGARHVQLRRADRWRRSPGPNTSLPFIDPFPVVRISGRFKDKRTKLTRVTGNEPRGARIRVACRGRGCTYRREAIAVKLVRVGALQRSYRPKATIEIRMTQPRKIGKSTRVKTREGKAPVRIDRCLMPGNSRPVRCPTA
jgi:hypothetical protein